MNNEIKIIDMSCSAQINAMIELQKFFGEKLSKELGIPKKLYGMEK